MAFPDLAKRHAGYVAGHALGEEIEYLSWPSPVWIQPKAKVERNPLNPLGEVLTNTVAVYVSKSDVPNIALGKDQVRLLADSKSGEPTPTYRVHQVIREGAGDWYLACVR